MRQKYLFFGSITFWGNFLEHLAIGSYKINYLYIKHYDSKMMPVFRLEDSDFGGIKDLTQTSTRNIWLTLESVQKEMDGSNEQCNFDYKGTFNITRNNFGFLGTQVRNLYNENVRNQTFISASREGGEWSEPSNE